ncbi:hypothetical protein FQN51_007774 [Onygenales sp. PD_10]|nr:hypothetical protein FQN51_007774 [Onygenales sp. PD_10]
MSRYHTNNCHCGFKSPVTPGKDLAAFNSQNQPSDSARLASSNHSKKDLIHTSETSLSYLEGSVVSAREGFDIVVRKTSCSEEQPTDTEQRRWGAPRYGPKTSAAVSSIIVSILEAYRMAPKEKLKDPWLAKEKFLLLIKEHIEAGDVIPMVLPAFPFKSPNKSFKVLGYLPDKGEEVALAHLNGLCKSIGEVYNKGARIDIVSDGLMYNDLLGIPDDKVWAYGQALRKLAVDTGCTNINFVRLVHLLGESEMGEPLSKDQYLRDASWFRTQLHERNIPENFDVSAQILQDLDTTLTYRGYIKFLEKDLDDGTVHDASISKRQIKKRHEETARNMIVRGKSFAIAIAKGFAKSIRLSIHPSTEATKISIAITPQSEGVVMTPWHSSLVRSVDGSIRMAHAGSVPALTHELIFEHGRPSYFREKSPLYDWGDVDVDFQYTYPSGIVISPRNKNTGQHIARVDMAKVKALAELCSPVVLKGFFDGPNQETTLEANIGNCACGNGIGHGVEFRHGITPEMNRFTKRQLEAEQCVGDAKSSGTSSSNNEGLHVGKEPLQESTDSSLGGRSPRLTASAATQTQHQVEDKLADNPSSFARFKAQIALTPGLQSFLKALKTSNVDSATENLISLLKRRQIGPSHSCAVATAYLLLRVVSTSRITDPAKLIDRVQNVGRRLIAAQPREMVVGNIVRRVLGLIREEAEDEREGEFSLSSDAGSDTRPQTPQPADSIQGSQLGIPGHVASPLRHEDGDKNDGDSERGTSSATMERSSSRPPLLTSHPSFAPANAPPVISMFRLLSHPQVESPQAGSPVNASPSGRIPGQYISKDFRAEVIDGIGEIVDELSQVEDQIASYALEHIHSDEVILTYTSSATVHKFLAKAAAKRKFTVIYAEAYPNNHKETHTIVAGPVSGDDDSLSPESFQKSLTELGATVILIPDSAVFALMSRVNKVILGTHSVLANGGLVAAAGTRVIANAAKVHKIPVIVVSGIYKLSPIYPFDYESLIEYGDASAVLPYEEGDLDKIDVDNPLYDYVPAELVDLYITNL